MFFQFFGLPPAAAHTLLLALLHLGWSQFASLQRGLVHFFSCSLRSSSADSGLPSFPDHTAVRFAAEIENFLQFRAHRLRLAGVVQFQWS